MTTEEYEKKLAEIEMLLYKEYETRHNFVKQYYEENMLKDCIEENRKLEARCVRLEAENTNLNEAIKKYMQPTQQECCGGGCH